MKDTIQDTHTAKQLLRKEIRERKRRYTPEELQQFSETLMQQLLEHPRFIAAQTVLLYYALPDEVNTHTLVDTLVNQGKTVLLPAVISDTEMQLRRYRSAADLREGAYHIMEPCGELFEDVSAVDVAVIPGMAFTPDGVRLGRGKGYYDRLLPRLTHAYTIGLCFPFQLLDSIPADTLDRKVDEVYTLCMPISTV